jgi:tetratricopeptide (TPR) repeat protein
MVAMCLAAADLAYPEIVRLPEPADTPGLSPALADDAAALAWLDAERANIVAAIRDAARHGPRRAAWLCADALRGYFGQRRFVIDWLSVARAGLAAARTGGDPISQAGAFHGLAHARYTLGNAPRAIAYLRRTIALAAGSGWSAGEAVASNNLGMLLQQQGRTDESMELLRRALDIYHRVGQHLGKASATTSLANLYRERGRLREGAQLAESARELYRVHGPRRTHALADLSLADLYRLLGRFGEAHRLLPAALAFHRETGRRRSEAGAWSVLARLYRDVEAIDEADRAARMAGGIADELQEPFLLVNARNALGLVLSAKQNHHAAAELHRDALGIAESAGLRYGAGEALLGLAAARAGGGNPTAAKHDAQLALDLARDARFAVLTGRALTILAGLQRTEGAMESALELATTALRTHEDTGHRLGAAQTHLILTMIHHDVGDAASAARHGQSAKDLYADLGVPAGGALLKEG